MDGLPPGPRTLPATEEKAALVNLASSLFLADPSYALNLSAQVFQGLLGRQLFGLLLGGAFSAGHIFRLTLSWGTNPRFHRECLAMVRTFLFHDGIDRLQPPAGLEQLLQG